MRNISVDGAAAAGIFAFGASNYLIEDVLVENTRANGIHNTQGAHHGTIRNARAQHGDALATPSKTCQSKVSKFQARAPRPRARSASWSAKAVARGARRVTMAGFKISGGPSNLFASDAPQERYSTSD